MLDRECSNTSFMDMRKVLQEVGIKNNEFFLNVSSKDILDIDVDLMSEPESQIILHEIKANMWYFFRRILKVPTSYGSVLHNFELTPIALILLWLYEQGFNVVVKVNGGGYGISTILAGISAYLSFTNYTNDAPLKNTAMTGALTQDARAINNKQAIFDSKGSKHDLINMGSAMMACLPIQFTNIRNIHSVCFNQEVSLKDSRYTNDLHGPYVESLMDIIEYNKKNPRSRSINVIRTDLQSPLSEISSKSGRDVGLWIESVNTYEFNDEMFDMTHDELQNIRNSCPIILNLTRPKSNIIQYGRGILFDE